MPAFLRAVSDNQPITPIGDSGWIAPAWAVGLLVVSFTFATWLYRRKTRV